MWTSVYKNQQNCDVYTMPQTLEHANTPLLRLSRITFAYPEQSRPLFKDLDFSYSPHQRMGIIGPTGQGKTSFLKLLVGLLKPQKGSLLYREQPPTPSSLQELRSNLGFVFQNPEDQLFCPTVLEDVAFGPLNLGHSMAKARQRSRQALKLVGLDGYEDRITHKLSGGEKKLLSLATILSMQPQALLLDEPSTGLDPDTRQHILEVIKNKLNLGLIIVSHDWDFLYHTTQELFTLEDGHLEPKNRNILHQHLHSHASGDVPHEHMNGSKGTGHSSPPAPDTQSPHEP